LAGLLAYLGIKRGGRRTINRSPTFSFSFIFL
jgi:hypothetical protein